MITHVTASPRSIARSGATPEFEALCKTLYGEGIDPDAVWDEVIKAGPDQADVHASSTKRKVLEGIALGSTVAGGILGVKEGASGVRGVLRARRAGEKVAGRHYRSLGLAGAATGGDAITTGVLASGSKKEKTAKREVFGKSGSGQLVPLKQMAVGHLKHAEVIQGQVLSSTQDLGHIKATSHTKPSAGAGGEAKPARGRSLAYKAGYRTSRTLNTREGRTGLAAGGVVGSAGTAGVSRARRNAEPGVEEYYGKADNSVVFKGVFTEIDEDQRTAFGWASVTEIGGQPVVDRQGDYITTEDIEKAAYEYVHKSRVGGDMHKRTPSMMGDSAHKVSDMIESVVFTDEKIAKMGLPDDFPRGWWVGYKIHDDETWNLVKSGERTGFSIHGKGVRKDLELDEVMGY